MDKTIYFDGFVEEDNSLVSNDDDFDFSNWTITVTDAEGHIIETYNSDDEDDED